MKFETRYDLGQLVYLITDPDQKERMVTEVRVTPNGMEYGLSLGDGSCFAYELEISTKPNILKQLNIETDEDSKK